MRTFVRRGEDRDAEMRTVRTFQHKVERVPSGLGFNGSSEERGLWPDLKGLKFLTFELLAWGGLFTSYLSPCPHVFIYLEWVGPFSPGKESLLGGRKCT